MREFDIPLEESVINQLTEEYSNEIVMVYNKEEDTVYHLTNRVTQIYGIPQRLERAQDYLIRYGVIQPESVQDFFGIFRRIKAGEDHAKNTLKTRDVNGEIVWVQMELKAYIDSEGNGKHAIGVIKDVTANKERELKDVEEEQYRLALVRESLLYYEVNLTTQKVTFGVEYLFKVLGVSFVNHYEELLELVIANIVYPADREKLRQTFSINRLMEYYKQGKTLVEVDYRRLNGNGAVTWVIGNGHLAKSKTDDHVMLRFYVSDTNAKNVYDKNLRLCSEMDSLTGAYNKPTAEYKIQKALDANVETGTISALLSIKLNNLKEVNDRMGYLWGDALLAEFGYQLSAMCQEQDIVGRNGLEFYVYLNNPGSVQKAEDIAEAISNIVIEHRMEVLKKHDFYISVKIAVAPENGTTFDELFEAMYSMAECETNTNTSNKDLDKSVYENIMRIFHDSQNVDSAVVHVMEQIIKHYDFQRASMFETRTDGTYCCTFEWCESDLEPLCDEYKILNEHYVDSLLYDIGDDNMLVVMPEELLSKDVAKGKLGVRFIYVFRTNGVARGFMCFDSHKELDNTQIISCKGKIQKIARILEVFRFGQTVNSEFWENGFILQQIVDGFNTCTYIIDPETYILKYVNQNTKQNIGEALPGTLCYQTIRGREKPCEDCPINRMIENGVKADRAQMYLDRYSMWAQINASLITLPGGKVYGAFSGYDFSEYKKEDSLSINGLHAFMQDTSLYDALTVSTDDYIFMCDMGTQLFYFPKKMVEEFDLPGQVLADAITIWSERIHEDDRQMFIEQMGNVFKGQTDTHCMEYRVLNKDGVWVWVSARGHIERDKNGVQTMFAGVMTNLGNKKNKIDTITGLPNKYEFEVRTRSAMANGVKHGILLVLGLDNFQYINNLYGWEFGDSVLKESAQRLLLPLPEKVELYKLDGDKFGVFFADQDVPYVQEYYRTLSHVFKQKRQVDEHRYLCTVSAGCAVLGEESTTFAELFKHANLALDNSKKNGKCRLTVFDEQAMTESQRTLKLLAQLQESVARGMERFELRYQAQVEPITYKVNSAEALLRWHSPDEGAISPDEFIPLLEQTGLVHTVGRWVIEGAYEVCCKWREHNPDFTISVNLSYLQLRDQTFLPYLQQKVEDGSINPNLLHLEITESSLVEGSQSLKAAFEKLRKLGFVMEMDDFGTGYSSLEMLKNAPADIVKIDRAFVRDITHSEFDATFIRFVVELCHSVDIKVCLEGVETWEEYYFIEGMGLDLIQGFLFAMPENRDRFEQEYLLEK